MLPATCSVMARQRSSGMPQVSSQPPSKTPTHTYKTNGLDQRISKNGPLSSKFFFFYDPAGQLIGEYRDNSSTATPTDDWLVRQETIWLEDIPVAVIRKPTATSPIQIYFVHADHLNTPRVIVSQSNTPVWRWENIHAFGANLPDEDPDGNSQLFEYHPRFPGQYFDRETGLHYNYFRYYEPETGRYISPDPIGLAGGLNVYGYASADPLNYFDPYGLFELPVLPQGVVDAAAGFGDGVSFGLTGFIRDALDINGSVNECSTAFKGSKFAGNFVLPSAGALRGLAFVGGTRLGNPVLNRNPFIRIGPGRMPRNGSLPAGSKIPRLSIGKGPGNPHIDLRIRPFD